MTGDTLQRFGNSFQTKVVAALLRDKLFLQQITDILDPKYFSSDAAQWIVKTINQYFTEYKTTPTLEVLKLKLDAIEVDILKTTVIEFLKDVFKQLEADDMQFVKDQITNFCKNQKLKNAILSSCLLYTF